jgi:putative transposase
VLLSWGTGELGNWGTGELENWRTGDVIPFFAFPPEIRRVIYTTNALESVHARVRKMIKTRGHFPTGEAATKLIWLAVRNITATWSHPAHHWRAALSQFAILYEDRFLKGPAA